MSNETPADLFAKALKEPDEERHWELVVRLQKQGDEDTFDTAAGRLLSDDPRERMLACDVLGQLGTPDRAFRSRTIPLLEARLSTEKHPEVLHAVIVALGHLDAEESAPAILPFASHPDSGVRESVAWTLPLGDTCGPGVEEALIALSQDEADEVRTWATLSLRFLDSGSAELREALIARVSDSEPDIRADAIAGLISLGEPAAITLLIEELEGVLRGEWDLDVALLDAAREAADPRVLPALSALPRNAGAVPGMLEDAIIACTTLGDE